MEIRLPDVKFQLYDGNNDQPMSYGDGTPAIFKTDENGMATVQGGNGLVLYMNHKYYLKEVETIDGYELSPINWTFTLVSDPKKVDTEHYIYPLGYTMRKCTERLQGC